MLPNVARYQLRHTPKYLIIMLWQLSAALPVATKALSSQAVACSPIAKLLSLLFSRFIRLRRRSKTSPTALHPEIMFREAFSIIPKIQANVKGKFIDFPLTFLFFTATVFRFPRICGRSRCPIYLIAPRLYEHSPS